MTSLGEAVVEVGADTAGFQKDVQQGVNNAFNNTAKSLNNLGKKMTSAGTKLSLGLTAPIVGIGVAAVRTGAQFDQTMSVMKAATGATDAQVALLNKQAVALGSKFPVSANDAASAMLELGKAGQSTAEITKSIPQVLSLAATEGLAMADAAGIMASTLAQFGLSADKAGIVTNALAGASNASKASVATLAESLKLVGPAARGVGLSVQETAGALAALAQGGLEGGIAGTSLAGVFNRLLPKTDAAAARMKELGIDFTNTNGTFKDISQIAGILQDKLGGLSETAKKAAISDIFGFDASTFTAVDALVTNGAKGIKEFTAAANNQSIAQKLMNARMQGTAGSIERFKGVTETAFLAIFQAAKPAIQGIIDGISGFIQVFVGMPKGVQTAIVVFGALAAAIGPVLVIVGTLITSFTAISGALAGVSLAAAAPIAAIVAIVAVFAILMIKSKAFRETFIGIWDQIKAAVMPAVKQIGGMFTGTLVPAFEKVWPVIEKIGVVLLRVFGGAVVGVIKGVMNVIVGVFKVITGVVQVFTGILTGDWGKAWQGVKNIVGGVLQGIVGAIQVFFNIGILKIFGLGFKLLTGLITKGWVAIKGVFTGAGAGIMNWIRGFWNAIQQHFRAAFTRLGSVFKAGWEVLKSVVSFVFNGIKTVIQRNIDFWVGLVKGFPGRIVALGKTLFNAGKSLITNLWDGAKAAFSVLRGFNLGSKINKLFGLPKKIEGVTVIPAFAQGTMSYPGGLGLVGERGPELVSLPRGSRIYTANQTRAMANNPSQLAAAAGGSSTTNVSVVQNFLGPTTGSARNRELDWTLRFASATSSATGGAGGLD